MGDAITVM